MSQTSFKTTDKQDTIIKEAQLLISLIDGKPYDKKNGLIRICEKLIEDYPLEKVKELCFEKVTE